MSDKIRLCIYDEHKIVQEGLCSLLQTAEDIEVVLTLDNQDHLIEGLKTSQVHVIVCNMHTCTARELDLISQIKSLFPGIKQLIMSVNSHEDVVLKIIKAGANGFLGKDTTRSELVEAVYTLRSGHDYFSNSVTVLLVNKYVARLKTDKSGQDIGSLSSREIEIMKMWGNSYTNKEIADKLFLSVRTVETHKNHIMQKLNLKTSVDMVKFAIRNNIIDL